MATLQIPSNVKCITSGQVPTTEKLKDGEFAFGKVGGVAKLYGNVNGVIIDFTGDSGGSKYANTSEIVDNAITLTSTSTLADLATQILAQKTKVVRMDWDENLQRIMPPILPSVGVYSSNVEFKVISTAKTSDISNPMCGLIEVFYNSVTELKNTSLLRKYIIDQGRISSNNKHMFSQTQWERVGNPSPLVDEIVITTDTVSPAINYGGTWEQIKDVFLLAAGDTYTGGSTGGSADAVVVLHDHIEYGTNTGGNDDYRMAYISETGTDYGVYYEPDGATVGSKGVFVRTADAGVDGTGKNMPPYLAVYMWRRVA